MAFYSSYGLFINPSNIFLHREGTRQSGSVVPKILDFGVAHFQTEENLTALGAVLGTYHYMSPEQARGENRRRLETLDQREENLDKKVAFIDQKEERVDRLEEAETCMREALAIREAYYGPDHETTAISVNNLAYLMDTVGNHDEAEELYRRALAIRLEVLGTDVDVLRLEVARAGRYR